MTNLKTFLTFLMQASSTFFDEDEGWTTINFPPGFYHIRTFEVFGGWKCKQINFNNTWYDLD